ncbi:MAG: glycosyltransferase family 4 protein [Caldilineaceae bacterium]|nr:glycosyltransferase family 4 protein [Caldilineaceae bacterium]
MRNRQPLHSSAESLVYGNSLGYLSGAPRVSTLPDAEMSGPKSHVLGIINGFEAHGWDVKRFIVGDRVPAQWRGRGSEQLVSGSRWRALAADAARVALSQVNARRAYQELGQSVDGVYERFALFQALGRPFQRQGIPWILETNAVYFREAKHERNSLMLTKLARHMEIQAYQQCDHLVVVSQALKQELIQSCHVPAHKIIVIPNGVDTVLFDPARHTAKRFFEGFTVGFVGRLYNWQGLDALFHAVHQLRQDSIQINVVVVGDGQMETAWRDLVTTLALNDQVHFAGRVAREEVPAYIAGFDVGFSGKVMPQSGIMYFSPLKLYEYLAMGKPVLGAADEDARRILRPDFTGYLFPIGDQEGLVNALRRAAIRTTQAAIAAQQARNDILQSHSWQVRVADLLAAMQQPLSATAPAQQGASQAEALSAR